MNSEVVTVEEVLDYLEPDWREHFMDAEDAAKFFQTYGLDDWLQAVRELRNG
jgi:hypothetical protein